MNPLQETTAEQKHSGKRQLAARRSTGAIQRKETLAGFLFVGPMLIGVTVLTLIPIFATFGLSLADWNFIAGFEV